jgi:hypothetical protein
LQRTGPNARGLPIIENDDATTLSLPVALLLNYVATW